MKLDLVYEPDCANAPSGFKSSITYAAQMLNRLITNPITVTIQVGWNDVNSWPIGTRAVGESQMLGDQYNPSIAAGELQANGDSVARQVVADAPKGALPPSNISRAQEKAWGMIAPNAPGIDGYIGISSAYAYNTNIYAPTVGNQFNLSAIAIHELTEAIGRSGGDVGINLVTYQSPGVLDTTPSDPGYFSVDGGKANLGNFGSADAADFQDSGEFNTYALQGAAAPGALSSADIKMIDALGFVTTEAAPNQFLLRDNTTGISAYQNGTAYSGPVSGIATDYAQITNDSINITGSTPNSFIHITGTGMDGINASACGGNNILDGSAGSDFLTGGPGDDIFYVDDRAPPQNVWSTLVNFHAGDHATVWGVSPADFTLTWIASAGAAGATGVTAVFSRDHSPTAGVTFAGYSMADVTSGRLAISYGVTANTQGATGAPYMNITGVG